MQRLNDLIQKEMTRKEFVTTVGFGLASVLGFSTLLEFLGKGKTSHSSLHAGTGYGSGLYGGMPKS
jgi:hypothetical protein